LLSTVVTELKAKGYERASAGTVVEAFEILMNLTEGEVRSIANDPVSPVALKIVGNAMLDAKGWDVLNAMMDRVHGKAKQSMAVTGTVNPNFVGFQNMPESFWDSVRPKSEKDEPTAEA
jgi:hypothetical protein